MLIVDADPAKDGARGDQPLDRALIVLDFVLAQRGAVTASRIAEATGLPAATAHRIIGQLEGRSLLKRAIGSKKVLPGHRLIDLGSRILAASLGNDRVHLHLETLAARLQEHCHVGIVEGQEVLYVDSARGVRPSGLMFEPGRRAPIYCTSIGKVSLSILPDEDLVAVAARIDFKRHTPTTIAQAAALVEQVRCVRDRGWAATDGEFTSGVVGCAVPLKNAGGTFVAGLGVSIPAARCRYDDVQKFVPDLKVCASAIAQEIESA